MAGIDKTFGTRAESKRVYDWLKRHNARFLHCHYGVESYDGNLDPDQERTILNTPTRVDQWMVRYCTIPVVVERLHEVYSSHKIGRIAAARLAARQGDYIPTWFRVKGAGHV